MDTRSQARQCVVQALYHWQLNPLATDLMKFNVMEDSDIKPKDIDKRLFQELLAGVIEHVEGLNEQLAPCLDRTVKSLDPIERAILWVGSYELHYRSKIPPNVVINEAIELAKVYGADQSYKYINGTLDKLSKNLKATN